MAFVFWVLGLGGGGGWLKLWTKIGIYATVFMGSRTTAWSELMAEHARLS